MSIAAIMLDQYGPVMNLEEVATLLKLKKESMYQQLYNGKMDIPHARLGKRYLFQTEQVAQYIDEAVTQN